MNNGKKNVENGIEREMRIEENRRAAETEAKEKERIMKQIRRAEMENEKMESRDNHNTRDDGDNAKNFTTEAKGSKARADDLTREGKNDNAREDDLATEAEDNKARTEERRGKSEAATREDTIEITTNTTAMVHEQAENFHSHGEFLNPTE